MLTAIYNVDKLEEFNAADKERGIRNFFRQLEDGFHIKGRDTLTYYGGGITRTLRGFGCIDTPGYDLVCSTRKGSIRIIENGETIYKVSSKAAFNAREAYARISY